ncbi:MAG: hypothetical protein N3A54_07400, partial [Patescibacteria group bacterium]|nr:hypothetical protein [Patescibacteria group bacterium]
NAGDNIYDMVEDLFPWIENVEEICDEIKEEVERGAQHEKATKEEVIELVKNAIEWWYGKNEYFGWTIEEYSCKGGFARMDSFEVILRWHYWGNDEVTVDRLIDLLVEDLLWPETESWPQMLGAAIEHVCEYTGTSWKKDLKHVVRETIIRKEKERGNDLYHLARRAMVKHKLRFGYSINESMRREIEEFKKNYPEEYEEIKEKIEEEEKEINT